jgi:hypothetical protein
MARTGRELAIAQSPQLARQRLLGDRDPEFLPEPLDQIDETPAHHAVDGRNGPLLDDDLQGLSVLIVEPRRSPWRSAGQKALGSMRVEAQHPIAHDLQRHAADLSRFGAGGPIRDRRQSQKAAGLIGIPRALRQSTELGGIKVTAERDGNSHGDLQTGDRHRESYLCPPGNPPHESAKLRLGISFPPGCRPAVDETCGRLCWLSAERLAVFLVRASPRISWTRGTRSTPDCAMGR